MSSDNYRSLTSKLRVGKNIAKQPTQKNDIYQKANINHYFCYVT